MENLPLQSKLSSSSKGALDWAYTWSKTRGSSSVDSSDLLVGIIQSHGHNSQPLQLLRHFNISPENLYRSLSFAPDKLPHPQENFPGETVLDQEARRVIEHGLSLAEQYNDSEKDIVRLRDLFGGILLEPTKAQKVLQTTLSLVSVPYNDLVEAYMDYLKARDATSLPEFLDNRFPKTEYAKISPSFIRSAVSGFSADTRAHRDLVGIGAEVDAFAYLISAKALQPPLAIGLFGDWGSGKTYFLQSLQERIHRVTKDARESEKPQRDISIFKYIVQIEFNAWHYVEGELWASLVEHIFHNLQTRPDETPTLLQQRQQIWFGKLEKLRRDEGTAQVLKDELEKQRIAKKMRIEQLKKEREDKLNELNVLKAKDVIAAIDLSKDDVKRFNDILQEQGVTETYNSAIEFVQAFSTVRTTLERGNALTTVLRQRGWRWTLGVVIVIVSGPLISAAITYFSQNQVPAVTNFLVSLSVFLGGLTTMLKAGTTSLLNGIEKVEQAQVKLDKKRRSVEENYGIQISAMEAELAEIIDAFHQAQTEQQEVSRQIEAVEQELQQITPRRVLLDFIRERVGSEDYRKRLGIAALIRRDFGQLWQLIHDQNDDFIKRDEGIEVEENRHLINRIVLYIDDLDRCPPDRVVQVLQAVHLLLAFPLFVVVVAVDSRWLSRSLEKHYEGLLASERSDNGQQQVEGFTHRATPQDYLEKIFQIPFWVKPLPEYARKRIVQGLVEKSLIYEDKPGQTEHADVDVSVEKQETLSRVRWHEDESAREFKKDIQSNPNPPGLDILEEELKFMEDLRVLLGLTPRSVKRFVNVYWLIKSIALSQIATFTSDGAYADFKQVLFLLAVLTGSPAISSEFLSLLREGEVVRRQTDRNEGQKGSGPADPKLKDLIEELRNRLQEFAGSGQEIRDAQHELTRLENWINSYDKAIWLEIPVSMLRLWASLVMRFSYRMEEG